MTILDLINTASRYQAARPLNLGGVASASGGGGGPPGGFIGRLPQSRVAYDNLEIGTSFTPASGMSLFDNLNHIRGRIDVLEMSSGGAGTGVTRIIAGTSITITPTGGTGVVTINSTASGGSGATTFLNLTDTPDSYTGQAFKKVRVNSSATALEFVPESGSSSGHTIKSSTTTFTQRGSLKFTGGVSIVDDVGNDETVVTISGGGVTQILAGTNISIEPIGGTGVVTINSTASGGTGGGVTSIIAGSGIILSPVNGLGDVTITASGIPHLITENLTSQITGSNTHYDTTNIVITNTLRAYVNGMREPSTIISSIDGDGLGFTITDTLATTDTLIVDYNDVATGAPAGGGAMAGWQTLTDAANISWNLSAGNADVTIEGNRTLNLPTNMIGGNSHFLTVNQDSIGSRMLTLASGYQLPDGITTPLSATANYKDLIQFVTDGVKMYVTNTLKNLREILPGPSDYADCVLWYSSDGVIDVTAGLIQTIYDKSGQGNNATVHQTNEVELLMEGGVNGKPRIYTGGAPGHLHIPLIDYPTGTVFYVYTPVNQSRDNVLFYYYDGENDWRYCPRCNDGADGLWECGPESFGYYNVHPLDTTDVRCHTYSGTEVNRYINAVAEVPADPSTDRLIINNLFGEGGTYGAEVSVYELAVFSRELSLTEIENITTYFRDKYGL